MSVSFITRNACAHLVSHKGANSLGSSIVVYQSLQTFDFTKYDNRITMKTTWAEHVLCAYSLYGNSVNNLLS